MQYYIIVWCIRYFRNSNIHMYLTKFSKYGYKKPTEVIWYRISLRYPWLSSSINYMNYRYKCPTFFLRLILMKNYFLSYAIIFNYSITKVRIESRIETIHKSTKPADLLNSRYLQLCYHYLNKP